MGGRRLETIWRTLGVAEGMRAAITAVGRKLPADVKKRLRALDFEGDYEAWRGRVMAAMKAKAPPAGLDHLQFVLIYAPIASDREGMCTEIIVGGHAGFVPGDNDFEACYEGYCPYPPYVKGYSAALTEMFRIFLGDDGDGDGNTDVLDALEMTFVRLCARRLCEEADARPLLAGKAAQRFICAGRNEVLDLLGAVTPEGWQLLPEGGTRDDLLLPAASTREAAGGGAPKRTRGK